MVIKRAGLYDRVSTDEQVKFGFSVQAQKDALVEYCKNNNLKIVDHYSDEGVSGGKAAFKRPEMSRLLEDVKAGKIDIILFTRLDRWFRNVKEYFKVQEILDEHGVKWKAIHEDYDTSTASGEMAVTIFLAIAQNERQKTAERITAVFENKRKQKEACFGGPFDPFGYMKQEDENGIPRLVKNPEEEQACEDFWKVLLASNNLNEAIRHMSNVYGIEREWKSWKRISRNEFYCGIYKGIEDFCEPYISREEWLKIQERRPSKSNPAKHTYIFKGLMRCPDCGLKLCGTADKKPYGIYKYYRCTHRMIHCNYNFSISERKFEKELLARLEWLIKDEIATVELEQAKTTVKPKNTLKNLKEKHRRLTVAYMANNISDDEYLKEDKELKALIAKAEQDAPPPPRDLAPLKELIETDFRSIYQTLTDEEKQRFWRELIKEIKIDGKSIDKVIFF